MNKFVEINNMKKYVLITDYLSALDINDKNVIIIRNIENLSVKELEKQLFMIKHKKLKSSIYIDDKNIICILVVVDENHQKVKDMISAINAIFINNKFERYNYIYDEVCNFLDEDFSKHNYCNFINDVCVAKSGLEKEVTMGCCHHFDKRGLFGKLILCENLKDKACTTKCISCKLFMCDEIKVKYKISEILLLDYFFNIIQKIIIKGSCFKTKEIIMKKLMFWSI